MKNPFWPEERKALKEAVKEIKVIDDREAKKLSISKKSLKGSLKK